MKKIAVGGWAFELYPEELFRHLGEIGYDGVSISSFKPYGIRREGYDTPEKRKEVKKLLAANNLEVSEYILDMWSSSALTESSLWLQQYDQNVTFAKEIDVTDTLRVDTGAPPAIPPGMTYEEIKDFYKKTFKNMAKRAAKDGFNLVWEFEPGFIVNEPANIVEVVKAVDEPNFKLEFDTCHANNCAKGVGHIEKGMVLEGGIMEFIDMCKDLIGLVHVIDSDDTVMNTGIEITDNDGNIIDLVTSRHSAFGEGFLNFDEILPALVNRANYTNDWWVIDMESNPIEYAITALTFLKNLNQKLFV